MAGTNLKQGNVCKSPLVKALTRHFEVLDKIEEEKNTVAEKQSKYFRILTDDDLVGEKNPKCNNDYFTHALGILDSKDHGFATLDNPIK